MQLTSQETAREWWKGATASAFDGIGTGIAVAVAAAAVLLIVGAAAPTLGALFAPFITLPGFGPFFPVPLMLFNTALTVFSNMATGGKAAVAAYHQQKHNDLYEARITALEQGRGPAIAPEPANPSRAFTEIVATDAKSKSFTEAVARPPVKSEPTR